MNLSNHVDINFGLSFPLEDQDEPKPECPCIGEPDQRCTSADGDCGNCGLAEHDDPDTLKYPVTNAGVKSLYPK